MWGSPRPSKRRTSAGHGSPPVTVDASELPWAKCAPASCKTRAARKDEAGVARIDLSGHALRGRPGAARVRPFFREAPGERRGRSRRGKNCAGRWWDFGQPADGGYCVEVTVTGRPTKLGSRDRNSSDP